MSRQLVPRQGETLAQFLDRVIDARKTSVNAIARQGSSLNGHAPKTWERKLRRWGQGKQHSIDPDGAEIIGRITEADFSSFVTRRVSQVDLLTAALERLDELEQRVLSLERE